MIIEPDLVSDRLKMLELMDALEESFVPFTRCPLCDEDEFIGYFTHENDYAVCGCGMIFQPMYMPQEQVSEHYKDTYRLTVHPYNNAVTNSNIKDEMKKAKGYMSFLNGIEPKRHLDIGSSTGTFLKMMKDASRCESVGVEPGDVFRDYSNKSGINTVADISEVDGKFDLISMGHVLEHLTNPLEMLETIKDLLADGGKLFVEVPKMMSGLNHPLMFTEITLIKMLNLTGLLLVEFNSKKFIRALVYKSEH